MFLHISLGAYSSQTSLLPPRGFARQNPWQVLASTPAPTLLGLQAPTSAQPIPLSSRDIGQRHRRGAAPLLNSCPRKCARRSILYSNSVAPAPLPLAVRQRARTRYIPPREQTAPGAAPSACGRVQCSAAHEPAGT